MKRGTIYKVTAPNPHCKGCDGRNVKSDEELKQVDGLALTQDVLALRIVSHKAESTIERELAQGMADQAERELDCLFTQMGGGCPYKNNCVKSGTCQALKRRAA